MKEGQLVVLHGMAAFYKDYPIELDPADVDDAEALKHQSYIIGLEEQKPVLRIHWINGDDVHLDINEDGEWREDALCVDIGNVKLVQYVLAVMDPNDYIYIENRPINLTKMPSGPEVSIHPTPEEAKKVFLEQYGTASSTRLLDTIHVVETTTVAKTSLTLVVNDYQGHPKVVASITQVTI